MNESCITPYPHDHQRCWDTQCCAHSTAWLAHLLHWTATAHQACLVSNPPWIAIQSEDVSDPLWSAMQSDEVIAKAWSHKSGINIPTQPLMQTIMFESQQNDNHESKPCKSFCLMRLTWEQSKLMCSYSQRYRDYTVSANQKARERVLQAALTWVPADRKLRRSTEAVWPSKVFRQVPSANAHSRNVLSPEAWHAWFLSNNSGKTRLMK